MEENGRYSSDGIIKALKEGPIEGDGRISLNKIMKNLFMPGSFINLKRESEKKYGKMPGSNLMYIPGVCAELSRLFIYYEAIIKPLYDLIK